MRTTEWTKVNSSLPEKDSRVLVWHGDGEYVDICKLGTNPWSLKPCWETETGVICMISYQDAWATIPYPVSTQSNVYDDVKRFPNCTVEVLCNTVTGEQSIGWWENE